MHEEILAYMRPSYEPRGVQVPLLVVFL